MRLAVDPEGSVHTSRCKYLLEIFHGHVIQNETVSYSFSREVRIVRQILESIRFLDFAMTNHTTSQENEEQRQNYQILLQRVNHPVDSAKQAYNGNMNNQYRLGIIVFAVLVLIGSVYAVLMRKNQPFAPPPPSSTTSTQPSTPPTSTTITYLTSSANPATYCNGADMDSAGYQKTIMTEVSTSTNLIHPTNIQIIKETIHAATSGMCREAMDRLDITQRNGVVYIPPIDAWAGSSIVMCHCKPEVEVNVRRIPGVTNVVWQAGKTDLIYLETPQPDEMIQSPLIIQGRARGSWFFEGSFPVTLTDWDGKIIAQGIAQAQGEWMTTDFVPFEATLPFTLEKDVYSNRGALILRKDNPSGLPEHDDALEISIKFAGAPEPVVACTLEAKLCPDGSAVGRTGPNCEFAPCPTL